MLIDVEFNEGVHMVNCVMEVDSFAATMYAKEGDQINGSTKMNKNRGHFHYNAQI